MIMKKTIAMAILLLLFVTQAVYAAKVMSNNTSVRTMPGSFYPIVTILNTGDEVDILEKGDQWQKIKTTDKKAGWISANAFNPIEKNIDYGAMAMDNSSRNISKIMVTAAVKGFFETRITDPNLNRPLFENPYKQYLVPSRYSLFKKETYANRWSQKKFQRKNRISQKGAFRIDENLVALSAYITARLTATGLSDNRDLVTYVNNVAQLVIESTEFYDLPISVHVAKTDQVFANSTPIGVIIISEGMLKTIKNESELACLISHEISHVTLRHGTIEFGIRKPKFAAEDAFAELGEELGVDELEVELDEMCFEMYERAIRGRKAEYESEADQRGMIYARRAGYSAEGMITLLSRVQARIPSSRNPEDASHWMPRQIGKRIATLEKISKTKLKPNRHYADFQTRYQRHLY